VSTPNSAPARAALHGTCWRKSSYSGEANDCVEIAVHQNTTDTKLAIRDSKVLQGPVLIVPAYAFLPRTGPHPLPGPLGQEGGGLGHAQLRCRGGDLVMGAHCHDVAQIQLAAGGT
jgi:hypothetical protein